MATNKGLTSGHNRIGNAATSIKGSVTSPDVSSKAPTNVSKGKEPVSHALKSESVTSAPIQDPSTPVLVNAGAMHLPMSSSSFLKTHTRTRKSSLKSQSPSPATFSISSILSSLQSDEAMQADIDAIAEIYGRSRLSMANEYGSHMSPIGSGPEAKDDNEDEDRLVLDTHAAVLHNNLETVEELPTPMSDSRSGFDPQDGGYGSKTTSASGPSTSPTISAASDEAPSASFLSVWQMRARQPATSRTVLGVGDVIAHGDTESYIVEGNPELRHDISGSGNSRAVKQLLQLSRT